MMQPGKLASANIPDTPPFHSKAQDPTRTVDVSQGSPSPHRSGPILSSIQAHQHPSLSIVESIGEEQADLQASSSSAHPRTSSDDRRF